MTYTLQDLIFSAICMLLGTEHIDFIFYETDLDWWQLRLWTRRN
ncbi:hypothetical protein ES705_24850 [subsurface metagenome]